MTVASGRGLAVAVEGRKIPEAVFYQSQAGNKVGMSGFARVREVREGRQGFTVWALKRWTRTRSKRGASDLMDLNVADCSTVLSAFLHAVSIHDGTNHCVEDGC